MTLHKIISEIKNKLILLSTELGLDFFRVFNFRHTRTDTDVGLRDYKAPWSSHTVGKIRELFVLGQTIN